MAIPELIAAPTWRAIDFISDLHLQASELATFHVWQQYMQGTPADAVFILGDLFEVWVGDDALQAVLNRNAQMSYGKPLHAFRCSSCTATAIFWWAAP